MTAKLRTLNKRPTGFKWSQYSQILPTLIVTICFLAFIILVGHWQFTGGELLMRGFRWTGEEDKKLKRLWPNTPETILLNEFYPRSMQALRERARILGVKRGQPQALNNIFKNQQALREKSIHNELKEKGMV